MALYVGSATDAGVLRKLDEESQLSDLTWTADGRHLSFLSARSGATQLWWIDADGGKPELVFSRHTNPRGGYFPNSVSGPDLPVGISSYEWSPDGRSVAFTSMPPTDPAVLRRAEWAGFRYDDARMRVTDLTAGQWLRARRTVELRLYDMRTREDRLLWRAPPGTLAYIRTVTWSPDGKMLALAFAGGSSPMRYVAATIDVKSAHFEQLFDAGGLIITLTWSPDGRAIAVTSRPSSGAIVSKLTILRTANASPRTVSTDLSPNVVAPFLAWIGDRLYFDSAGVGPQRENGGLYELQLTGDGPTRITSLDEKISDCGRPVGHLVACVWQSPTRPPRVSIIDLRTRALRGLTDVNPELAAVQLGPVEELHWANEFGDTTNGYLVLPPAARRKGARLPLVVMGYGFDGDFVAAANWWMTSYPAQAFARDGLAVLLVNAPKWNEWSGNDFQRGARAWGYGPLSSLKVIIGRLSRRGLIDAGRVGFAGHSWSGFWVQFTASHSGLLRAAALHNGGTSTEPGTYWEVGQAAYRALQDHFMGGGPYPPTLRNYIGFSASLTADRVKIPILLQSDADEAPLALEYYAALRAHHVPVDFHIYPNDGHNFFVPSHRLVSMQENLDWFEFWLLGRVRRDRGVADQYAVWTGMRRALRRLDGGH